MFNKLITYLYYSLFVIAPLIMSSSTSELFEFNKMIFIYLVAILISFFWFLKMILAKKIFFRKTPLDIPIFLFLISQLLSTIFSIDRHTSLFGYYGRFNGGLISIIAYLLLFYGFVSNIEENIETIINILLKISLFASLAVVLWGLPGRWGHDMGCLLFTRSFSNTCWTEQFRPAERMFSTLGQPNWLGAYLAINFFIGVYFLIKNRDNYQYFRLTILYLLLNFASVLFTRSRSAIGAVIACAAICFFFLIIKRKKEIAYLLVTIILIPIVLFKTGIPKIDRYLDIMTYFKIKKVIQKPIENKLPVTSSLRSDNYASESFDIRKIVWEGAIKLGKKYPFFGTGVETFAYSYYFVRPKEHNLTSEWDFLYNKAHNEYLNYLATAGYIGLGSYFLLIFSFIFLSWKNIKYQTRLPDGQVSNIKNKAQNSNNQYLIACLFLSWGTILITNFFGFSTTTVNLYFYLIPALIIATSINNQQLITLTTNQSNFITKNKKTLIIILIIITLYFLLGLIRYYIGDIKYAAADNYSKAGDYQQAANLLNEALKLRYEHVYEDKLSYVLANFAFVASYQKQEDTAQKLILLSKAYNQKSMSAAPKNVLYWKTQVKNDYLFYQITLDKKYIQEAITTLQKVKDLSPTDPKISYSLAIYYSLLEDETKDKKQKQFFKDLSIKEINETINLKPDYRDGYFLKGQLLKKYGLKDEAKKTFDYILLNLNPNDDEAKKEIENLSK